jgi:hypothetical protein
MSKKILCYFIFSIFFLGIWMETDSQAQMMQQELIKFPVLGVLEVKAQTIEGQLPSLIIRDASKKEQMRIEMGYTLDPDPTSFKHSAGIEFKVFHISGLPDPLLIVIATGPGGSDTAWEVILIGVVSGKIQRLWTTGLGNAGGVFIGDLGRKRGIGIAQWAWRGGECHACPPDEYSLQLYIWNKERLRFDIGQHFTIKRDKFETIEKVGLRFRDLRRDFNRLTDFW